MTEGTFFMTVFIAHAPEDRDIALTLERYLERRGVFVELETGERGFRFTQAADAVVVLWSRAALFSPQRMQIERRCLEAWADERLVFVKLDTMFAPVGLRDLPAIDASFEPQRDIAWAAVARGVSERLTTARARVAEPPASEVQKTVRPQPGGMGGEGTVPAPAPASRRKERRRDPAARRGMPWLAFSGLIAALAVIAAGLWMLSRNLFAPPSATVPGDTVAITPVTLPWFGQVDLAMFVQFGVWVAALLALALLLLILFRGPWSERRAPGRSAAPPAREEGAEAPAGPALFVSYAHADQAVVSPVVDTVTRSGRPVWIDTAGIEAGDGWAGEIVRAIKAAGGVLVMCSPRAFESDHVKREVYLADRYKKPMLPVLLEPADMPEDFEYFFAGVQWLKLYELPELDRAPAIARALAQV
jgi:hypothetical protein